MHPLVFLCFTKNIMNVSYIILIRKKISLLYAIPITIPRKSCFFFLLQVQATKMFGVLGYWRVLLALQGAARER